MIEIAKGKWGVLGITNLKLKMSYLIHNGSIGYFLDTDMDFGDDIDCYWHRSIPSLASAYINLTLISEEDTLEEAKAVIKMMTLME